MPTAVPGVTTGQPVQEAWGDAVAAAIAELQAAAGRVHVVRTTDQSIPNSAYTSLAFNSERYDVGGYHDPAVNPSRLTVPAGKAGPYIIGGAGSLDALNPTGAYRAMRILLNGGGVLAQANMGFHATAGTASVPQATVTMAWDLVAGDYVELQLYQDSGAAINALGVGVLEFWMHQLRP